MVHNQDISSVYDILLDILLTAEGNKNTNFLAVSDYEQKNTIQIPSVLVPLLYAASNSVQMAVAFLPYYLRQKSDYTSDLKTKIITDDAWFVKEIYPHILKFILSDTMRTFPVSQVSEQKIQIHHAGDNHKNIVLYDSHVTDYPPYYGMNIHDLKGGDSDKTYYLVGDIQDKARNILETMLASRVIYGISPPHNTHNNWQDWLYKRINFFSNTVLAGSLNMQLPFIEHYLQAGLAPLSFYHLLYRGDCSESIIQNALCLLNNKAPDKKMLANVNYQRLSAHTDLHIVSPQDNQDLDCVNYLTILSVIA